MQLLKNHVRPLVFDKPTLVHFFLNASNFEDLMAFHSCWKQLMEVILPSLQFWGFGLMLL